MVTVTPSSCTTPNGSIDITAVNGVPSYTFSWSNGATTEDVSNVFPGNYFVTVTDADLCKISTSVFVPSNIYDYQPEICLISVDTSNNTNYIVWQKNITYGVEKYKIYRESSVPNNFQFVADVPFSALSEYTDLVANADVHSWRYRLSSVDSCGNEIPSYVDHKTIYLDVTFGTTNLLTWNYYAGFPYNKFYISRYDIVNGWQLYDSVPGNIYTYTDITPPPTGDVRYLVEAKAPFNCIPQLKTAAQTSNKTKSNVKHNDFSILPTKLEDLLNSYLLISPNPARDEVWVNFNTAVTSATNIKVTDVLGKEIYEQVIYEGKKVSIPLTNFKSGLYFIQILSGKNSIVKKFVKE
ncbi:MAG: T9SS type A sorting domain-containing protein [Bacteroidetes bacterium]|nr:T9SS type A sorting domain-containing protein [Bacteroidota bacterium]